VRELRPLGSVRGAGRDACPYRDLHVAAVKSRGDERWSQSARMYLKQVWIRETNVSEPSMTRRKPDKCRQNQGRVVLLGQAYRKPDYWAGGDRRLGGVNLIRALGWNCGNQWFRCQGKSSSSKSYEAKSPKRNTGTDRPVRAMKTGNAVRAKRTDQAAALRIQLATGGDA
jgi:hypothetical protein